MGNSFRNALADYSKLGGGLGRIGRWCLVDSHRPNSSGAFVWDLLSLRLLLLYLVSDEVQE
jgi:hypothetical protein